MAPFLISVVYFLSQAARRRKKNAAIHLLLEAFEGLFAAHSG